MDVRSKLEQYFHEIDEGDREEAASHFTEDVTWIHTEVWEPHGYETDHLNSRDEVEKFLKANTDELREENIKHVIDEIVVDGENVAFLARAVAEDDEVGFFGWAKFDGDLIETYIIAPTRW
jgi:ketosteroid isomerase-like protein